MAFKIAIVGVGAVGSSIAQALICKNIEADLILYDKDEMRCQGEVRDLSDSLGFSLTSSIVQGTYTEVREADIVIIAAGRPQKKGETRIDLTDTNKQILFDVLMNLNGLKKDAIVMIVSNPLDLLTYCSLRYFAHPKNLVFGTGTFLDSQRLGSLLSEKTGISQKAISAWIIGEHGESQVVAWSSTRVAGIDPNVFGINENEKRALAHKVRDTAAYIIDKKGATYFGIASCVATLCQIIKGDMRMVVPVSWFHESYGVCMSLPVVLGAQGIEKVVPFPLTQEEQGELTRSVELLKMYQALVLPERELGA